MATLPTDLPTEYSPRSKFYPNRFSQCLRRPRRTIRSWGNAPISIRFAPLNNDVLNLIPSVVLFSYDKTLYGNRICIWANKESELLKNWDRCRLVANYLWQMMQRTAQVYRNVPVDLGDGAVHDGVPKEVFCFSRKRGLANPLLPNPYLLRPRSRLPYPIPFEKKQDGLYFRGSSTGDLHYDSNQRIAMCLAAKSIERSDCYISHVVQVDAEFVSQMNRDDVIRPPDPLVRMNRYRMVVDVDGNTSSWDRFLSIATFGSVPIRFEDSFEECWHSQLSEGRHYIAADRNSLGRVVADLRKNLLAAKQIAIQASRFATEQLAPSRIREWFEEAWSTYPV